MLAYNSDGYGGDSRIMAAVKAVKAVKAA